MNLLSLPIKVGMWWRGLLCQPWPASISLVWLCGGGASQGIRCPLYLHSLFRAKSCMRPGGGMTSFNQQSPSHWALRNTIGKNYCLFSIAQPTTAVESILGAGCCQGPRTDARCLTRPPNFDKWHDDCCYTCSHFIINLPHYLVLITHSQIRQHEALLMQYHKQPAGGHPPLLPEWSCGFGIQRPAEFRLHHMGS